MATDHSNGPPVDAARDEGPNDYANEHAGHADASWQNGSAQAPNPPASGPSGPLPPPAGYADEPTNGSDASRPRPRNGGRSASAQARVCKKCGLQLTGQFVRALDGTFHLDCFKCRVNACPPFSTPLSSLFLFPHPSLFDPVSFLPIPTSPPLYPRDVLTLCLTGLRRDRGIQVLPRRR